MIPSMWLAASPASAIIASVNLVSSRQLLYGTSLAPFCKGAGTWLTFLFGTAFSTPTALASFAMTALFICLLRMQKLTRANVVAALTAAVGAIICKAAGLAGPTVLMGEVCGVAFGTIFDKRGGRQNQIARMVHRSWSGLARHAAGCVPLAAKNAGGLTPRIMPAVPTAPRANARTPARRTGRSG